MPGVDVGSGFVQDVSIEFVGHEMVGDVGDLPAGIIDGDFGLDGTVFPNMINLPCDGGPAKLILKLWPDNPLSEATYVEEFRR